MNDKLLIVSPPSTFFPLGIAYVLSCLERHGIDFDFYDANSGNGYEKMIRKRKYYAVASGGLISQFRFFAELFRIVRQTDPSIDIILGGNITRDMQTELLFDKLTITYGVIGEAETSLPLLIDAILRKKNDLEDVPGLIHRDPQSGVIKKNPVRRLDLSKEQILPAWHRFNVDYYINTWELGIYGQRRCMPVITGRGCTGNCSFCSPTIGSYSKRPVEHVVHEIESLCDMYDFDWIYFVNELFYPTKEEIAVFCESYKSLKKRKKWVCELRVDSDIDAETFRLMKSADCVAVVCGVESGSNRILSLMNKRTTREMIVRFFRTAQAAGLPCEGSFQVGNEGETETEIKETIDMVINEKMRVNERLPITYPGTKIYKNAVGRNLIGKDEWEYLQTLDFTADIWDYSWSKKHYVNISDIPNERFWSVVVGELRRFNTFNLKNFVPRNMTYSYRFGMLIRVTGLCSECGCAVTFVTPRKMLGIRTYCINCFRTVQFNLYELPEFRDHYHMLCAELQKSKRLVVAGARIEATYMLQYDYFNLDYSTLKAFVEIDRSDSGIPDFCHLPRISLEELPQTSPDALLIVDDPFDTTELKIRTFYLRKNLPPPRILSLLPDEKRPFRAFIQFARRHETSTFPNKHLVIAALAIPILWGTTKSRLLSTIKSRYDSFNRNPITRKILNWLKR